MISLNNLKQKQAFLKVLIFSLVTVMIWVGFSIFRSQNKTNVAQDLQTLALPLNPNISIDIVNKIKNKRSFSDEELSNFTIYKLVQTKTGEQVVTTGSLISPTLALPSPEPATSATPSPLPLPSTSPVDASASTQTAP
jgi:hypothetical protein